MARLMDTGLPGCASGRVDRTLKTIVRDHGLAGAAISARHLVARDQTARNCTATVTAADGARYQMTYRIVRNDQGRVRVRAAFQPI
jgi:hypothetical protein